MLSSITLNQHRFKLWYFRRMHSYEMNSLKTHFSSLFQDLDDFPFSGQMIINISLWFKINIQDKRGFNFWCFFLPCWHISISSVSARFPLYISLLYLRLIQSKPDELRFLMILLCLWEIIYCFYLIWPKCIYQSLDISM